MTIIYIIEGIGCVIFLYISLVAIQNKKITELKLKAIDMLPNFIEIAGRIYNIQELNDEMFYSQIELVWNPKFFTVNTVNDMVKNEELWNELEQLTRKNK